MPSHCFQSPRTAPAEKNIMYTARWLAPLSSSRRRALEEFSEVPEPHRELQTGPPGGGGDIFSGLFGDDSAGPGGSTDSSSGPSMQAATDAVPIVNT